VPSLYNPVDRPLTALRWPVVPEGLYWIARLLDERYRRPIYVTENGLSNVDWVARDGGVHDPQRIDFTARYLVELRRAIEGGADVRGYFHWSLMDNFEWAEGYKERFGLIHVDYATGRRTPKDSARWYRETIAANGANL
jgi:beta-glucosidase